ncbi:hypothetical protein BX600DRAFT_110749 [Xylariales sp. PMI_506]|nr:hypothetical protein BX600DRAFT_110749 [Xylariales sp. PMI_506]
MRLWRKSKNSEDGSAPAHEDASSNPIWRRFSLRESVRDNASTSGPSQNLSDDSYLVRDDIRHGLFVLVDQPEDDPDAVDIVALHGLNGHWRNTWRTKSPTGEQVMWLQDFLPEQIPHARIMSFGYDSVLLFGKSVANIGMFAEQLLEELMARREGQAKNRPLIFVCHSLGGVVVKKAIVKAHEKDRYSSLLNSVRGVMFFGTPHRGSSFANWGSVLANIASAASLGTRTNQTLSRDLQSNSVVLQEINMSFIERAKALQIFTFYETDRMQLANNRVVDEESAILGFPNEVTIALKGDHRSICRFEAIDEPRYRCVWTNLQNMSGRAANEKSLASSSTTLIVSRGPNSLASAEMPPPKELTTELVEDSFSRWDSLLQPRVTLSQRRHELLGGLENLTPPQRGSAKIDGIHKSSLKTTGMIDSSSTALQDFREDTADRSCDITRQNSESQTPVSESEQELTQSQTSKAQVKKPARSEKHRQRAFDPELIRHENMRRALEPVRRLEEQKKQKARADAQQIEADCRRTLSYIEYESHRDRIPQAVAGTCQWLLQHKKYRDWREAQTSNLLWLSADPGCGKSVLASYLVDHLRQPENKPQVPEAVCFFFFKADNDEQNDACRAMTAILHQLYQAQPWLTRHATKIFAEKRRSMLSQFRTLWQIFIASVSDTKSRDVILVIDGLDECEPITREQLLQCLARFYTKETALTEPPFVKTVIASRPDNDIKIAFDILPTIRLRGEDEPEAISHDVELVIQHHIRRAVFRGIPETVLSDLQLGLIKGADRTFLWTTLVIDLLDTKRGASRRELMDILQSRDIYRVYRRLLENSSNPEEARRLLQIVLAAARPMTLSELSVAIAIHPSQQSFEDLENDIVHNFEERIKDLCGNFVRIVRNTVFLVHQTAREFLLREESSKQGDLGEANDWQHSIVLRDGHNDLLNVSLQYLLFLNDKNSRILAEIDSGVRPPPALLDYIARFWTRHYAEVVAARRLDSWQLHACMQCCNWHSPAFKRWFPITVSHRRLREHKLREGSLHRDVAYCLGLDEVVRAMDDLAKTAELDTERGGQDEDSDASGEDGNNLIRPRRVSLNPHDIHAVYQPHTITPGLRGQSPLEQAMMSGLRLGSISAKVQTADQESSAAQSNFPDTKPNTSDSNSRAVQHSV